MLVAGAIVVLLVFAAWRDLATRTIPDAVSIAIAVLGFAARLSDGWAASGTSIAASVALFLLLLPLYSRGLVGGGDLKLLAALAFGLPPLSSYQMFSAVVFAGGVLALVYLALRRFVGRRSVHPTLLRHRSAALRVLAIELWRIRKGAPLPYAIAIAVGASLVIGHQGA